VLLTFTSTTPRNARATQRGQNQNFKGKNMLICGNCHAERHHVTSECPLPPQDSPADATWCGECDKRTRLVDHGSYMTRCRRCWRARTLALGKPLDTLLAQHKRCGGCDNVVYAWDQYPCGGHQQIAS